MTYDEVHITRIAPRDTVLHNGKLMTVCRTDLTWITGMGRALFGDTYHLGHKPVLRARMPRITAAAA